MAGKKTDWLDNVDQPREQTSTNNRSALPHILRRRSSATLLAAQRPLTQATGSNGESGHGIFPLVGQRLSTVRTVDQRVSFPRVVHNMLPPVDPKLKGKSTSRLTAAALMSSADTVEDRSMDQDALPSAACGPSQRRVTEFEGLVTPDQQLRSHSAIKPRTTLLQGRKLSPLLEPVNPGHSRRIYYAGQGAKSKPTPVVCVCDSGRGPTYALEIREHDQIIYRYEVKNLLGSGTFGYVVRCFDHRDRKEVAVKLIKRDDRFRRWAQDEIKILELLRQQGKKQKINAVQLLTHFMFRDRICLTFELMGQSLADALSTKGPIQRMDRLKKILLDVLTCLKALKELGIIHCDLKPENILVPLKAGEGPVKVADFGLSCFQHQRPFDYIQTRNYRSPEVIQRNKYGPPIDMWSLGCIAGELCTGQVMFRGCSANDQLAAYIETLGVPEKNVQKGMHVRRYFTPEGHPKYADLIVGPSGNFVGYGGGKSRDCDCYRVAPGKKPLSLIIKRCEDKTLLDFIHQCLAWDPAKRLTPVLAKKHIFLRSTDASPQPIHHQRGVCAGGSHHTSS